MILSILGYLTPNNFGVLLDYCVELSPKTEPVLLKPSTSEGKKGTGLFLSQEEYLNWKKNNSGNENMIVNSLPSYIFSDVDNNASQTIPTEIMKKFETDVQENAIYKGQYIKLKKIIYVIVSEKITNGLTNIKLYAFTPKGRLLYSRFLGKIDSEHFFSAQFFPDKRNKFISSFIICNAHVNKSQTTFLFSEYIYNNIGIEKKEENAYTITYMEEYKPPFELKYPTIIAKELVKDWDSTQKSIP